MPSVWTYLRAALNPVARRYGQYTAYALSPNEAVGAIHGFDVDDARHYLRQNGYEPQYLSAAKRHPETGQLHDLSYRRVPSKHPALIVNERLARDFRPEQCQFHVHVFDRDGSTEWFSHYEARPDLLEPSFDPTRLRTHYRPTYGQDYFQGLTDLDI